MVAFDNTLGALLIGVVVAAILYGFTCVQSWYYFTQYPSDPWHMRLLVAAVLVTETCHQAMITHALYTYVIIDFGVYEQFMDILWSMVAQVVLNAVATLLVQCFLAARVYKLSNKSWLATSIVMILVIAEFLVAIIFSVKASHLGSVVDVANLKNLSMTVNALSATADAVVAAFLCYLLRVSRTGFRKSDTLISKLIVFTINTGLLTSLCAIGSLISVSLWPHAWIYVAFFFCSGRLYCNSLLATLNARKQLRGGSEDDMSLSFQGHSAQQKTNHSILRTSSKRTPTNISIRIDTSTVHDYIQDEYSSRGDDLKNPEVDCRI